MKPYNECIPGFTGSYLVILEAEHHEGQHNVYLRNMKKNYVSLGIGSWFSFHKNIRAATILDLLVRESQNAIPTCYESSEYIRARIHERS